MARDLAGEDITVLMIDGEHLAERCVVVAGDHRRRHESAGRAVDGSTENKTVVAALLADLVARGLRYDDGLLVVLDGAKALSAAVREVFGDRGADPALHPAQATERRRPPARQGQGMGGRQAVKAFVHPDPDQGLRGAKDLAGLLAKSHPGAAAACSKGWTRCSPSPASASTAAWPRR